MASPAAILSILVNADTRQAQAALARTQAQLKSVESNSARSAAASGAAWQKAGSRMQSVGKSMTRNVSLPAAAAGAASIKMAVDFNDSMERIRNLVGASQKQVDSWSSQILALGPKLGKSPQELADALYFVSSSGIKASKAMGVVVQAAKASALGLGETKTVADATTSAMNAYRKSGLSAAKATNILALAVKLGKGEPEDFAKSIGRVIPIASKLGVPFKDVAAALASMTLQGLDAAEATTALRGIFSATFKPTKDANTALKAVGLSAEELRKSLDDKGTLATLQMLSTRFHGNVESMAAVFPNIRGLVGAFNLTGDSAKRNAQIFKELNKNTDIVNVGFQRLSGTQAQKLRQALAGLQAAAIQIGQELLPALVPVAKSFASIAGAFAKMPGFARTILIGAVVFGPMLRGLGMVVSLYGKLKTAAAGAAVAQEAANLAGSGGALPGVVRTPGGTGKVPAPPKGGGKFGTVGKVGGGVAAGAGAIALNPALLPVAAVVAYAVATKKSAFVEDANNKRLTLAAQLHNRLTKALRDGDIPAVAHLEHRMRLVAMGMDLSTDATHKQLLAMGKLVVASHGAAKGMKLGEAIATDLANNRGKADVAMKHFDSGFKHLSLTAQRSAITTTKIEGQKWVRLGQITQNQLDRLLALEQRAHRQSHKRWQLWSGDVIGTVTNANTGVTSGVRAIVGNLNSALKAMGVKPVTFSIAGLVKGLPSKAQDLPGLKGGKGGGKQAGGMVVQGAGSGDKVALRAMVEPGERVFVLNRNASRALEDLHGLNAAVPRFAEGGGLGRMGQAGLDKVHSAAQRYFNKHRTIGGVGGRNIVALGRNLQRAGYEVGEHPAFGGVHPVHVAGSYHYQGRAIDVNDDVAPFASGTGEPGSLDRLYAKLKKKKGIIELLWRVPHHYDHLHVAMKRGGLVQKLQAGGMARGRRMDKRNYLLHLLLHGRPPAFDAMSKWDALPQMVRTPTGRNNAGDYRRLKRHLEPFGIAVASDLTVRASRGQGAGPLPTALARLQRGGKVNWPATLNADQLRTLAHFAGMPNAGLMAQIAQAESMGNPNARGGAGEYGLWQIMPFWGGGASLLDPLKNARKAKYILGQQGLGAWSTYNNGAYRGYSTGHFNSAFAALLRGKPAGGTAGAGGGGGGGGAPLPTTGIFAGKTAKQVRKMQAQIRRHQRHRRQVHQTRAHEHDVAQQWADLGVHVPYGGKVNFPEVEAGDDPAAEAAQALADAIQAQAEAMAELSAQLKQQNEFATAVTTVSLREAWRAMADVISGQIAGQLQPIGGTKPAGMSGINRF